jgi:hypothetical protein
MFKFSILTSPKYWYISWAIFSSIFILNGMIITIFNTATDTKVGFIFLIFEYIAPMLFGVYLANKEKYKINFIKFLFIFAVLIGSIFFLGKLAMGLSPMLILVLMLIIKITKDEAKWVFGSMMLYMLSAAPGFFTMVYFDLGLYGLALMYLSRGAIYGKVMEIINE